MKTVPVLLVLLAGSGCAALIYEIVWFQLLQLVIGSSAVSLGLLLAAYMDGLCVGSAALPRVVSRRVHPLKVYAVLEFGIGVFGVLVLLAVPLVGRLYVAAVTQGVLGLVLRGTVAAVCLLPPTLLMGASLPALARWLEATPRGVSWVGWLYSANIAGAVCGCLLAGFYLLRVHDMAVATYVAAAHQPVVVALASVALSRRVSYGHVRTKARRRPSRWRGKERRSSTSRSRVSGLSALGAEVVWTRLLSLLLGGTVYTFSIILAVFLVGLWAGSSAGSFAARRVSSPAMALTVCQLLLVVVDRLDGVHAGVLSSILAGGSVAVAGSAGSIFKSIWCAVSGQCSPPRCCGAQAFPSPWRPPRSRVRIPGGCPERSMPRTRRVLSPARWHSALC